MHSRKPGTSITLTMKTQKPKTKKQIKRAVKSEVSKQTPTEAVDSVELVVVKSDQKLHDRKRERKKKS